MKRNAKKAKGIERKGKKDRNLYNSRDGSYREPRISFSALLRKRPQGAERTNFLLFMYLNSSNCILKFLVPNFTRLSSAMYKLCAKNFSSIYMGIRMFGIREFRVIRGP